MGAGRPGFVAVRDDRAARRLAAAQGVPVLGALRVIVKAKERGLIPLARPALEKLRGSGADVSDEWIEHAIALAGETWRRRRRWARVAASSRWGAREARAARLRGS